MTFGGEFMATLRYKNPTTQKWELVGVSGGGSSADEQIIFAKRAEFPNVGNSSKVYIDTETNTSYIFINGSYQLVGDGYSTTDWGLIS